MDRALTPAVDRGWLGLRLAGMVFVLLALLPVLAWNFPFFHSLVELATVVLAGSICTSAWLATGTPLSDYFRFLGVAFLFAAFGIILHAVTYEGVGIVQPSGTAVAAQLWMLTRVFVVIGLLGAPWFLKHRLWLAPAVGALALLFVTGVWTILVTRTFPTMWTETYGLTSAKVAGEWVIVGLLIVAGAVHLRARESLDRELLQLLIPGIVALALAEVAFTLYVSSRDAYIVVGHYLQILGFWALFEAFVVAGVLRPRVLIRAQLAESEERFRRLAHHAPAGIVEVDEGGRAVLINDTLCRILGRPREQLVDGRWTEAIHPDERDEVRAAWSAAIRRRESLSLECRAVRPGSGVVWVSVHAVPLPTWKGGPAGGFLAMIWDITLRKMALEELSAYKGHLEELVSARTSELERAVAELGVANSVKDEFIANVRHELRTPLNSIIGFSAILRDGLAGPVNDEQRLQLEMIHDAGQRLNSLIKDIMYVSRIESGVVDLIPEDFDVAQLVWAVMGPLSEQAAKKGVEVQVDVEDLEAHTDVWALGKVLGHLASNAVKFTDEGSVRVTVARQNGTACLVVSDTGPGIPDEYLGTVLEKFHQVPPPSGGKSGGAGIGLPLCRVIAEMLGGELRVESMLGSGTTATLEFPLRLSR